MLHKKRAVSTLIATILMINVAIVMGGVLLAWGMGLLGSYTSGTGVQYMLLEEKKEEAIAVENVWLQAGTTIRVFVRNVGTREALIKAVYVNGTSVSTSPSLPRTLYVSGNLTLTISSILHNAKYPQLIVVATARGNQARGQWTG